MLSKSTLDRRNEEYEMSGSEDVSTARKAFKSGKTLPVEWRIRQLKAMQRMVEENEVNPRLIDR